jgi:hypothetical protein
VLAHAPSKSAVTAAPIPDNGAGRNAEDESLGWVFLEIALALAVAVLIVWWTLPRKPRDRNKDEP